MSDEISFASTNESAETLTADEIRLRRQKLLALLKGRWHWAILSSLLFSSVFGYFAYKSVGAIYRSVGTVQINDDTILADRRRGDNMVNTKQARWTSFLRVQDSMIKSPAVGQDRVVIDLHDPGAAIDRAHALVGEVAEHAGEQQRRKDRPVPAPLEQCQELFPS